MMIDVSRARGEAGADLRRYVELRLESALGAELQRFEAVVVSVAEAGPGEAEAAPARCRIIGRLRAGGRLLAESTHAVLFEAIDLACAAVAARLSGGPSPRDGRAWVA